MGHARAWHARIRYISKDDCGVYKGCGWGGGMAMVKVPLQLLEQTIFRRRIDLSGKKVEGGEHVGRWRYPLVGHGRALIHTFERMFANVRCMLAPAKVVC
jgi:hypothetical protein